MSNEEAQKILDSMHGINPENLQGEAKKLFEAIMKIADERDSLRKTVERQNLEIMAQKDAHDFDAEITNDVNEIAIKLYKELEERDQIINAMAEYISKKKILVDKHCYVLTAEAVKQWFEKQIK